MPAVSVLEDSMKPSAAAGSIATALLHSSSPCVRSGLPGTCPVVGGDRIDVHRRSVGAVPATLGIPSAPMSITTSQRRRSRPAFCGGPRSHRCQTMQSAPDDSPIPRSTASGIALPLRLMSSAACCGSGRPSTPLWSDRVRPSGPCSSFLPAGTFLPGCASCAADRLATDRRPLTGCSVGDCRPLQRLRHRTRPVKGSDQSSDELCHPCTAAKSLHHATHHRPQAPRACTHRRLDDRQHSRCFNHRPVRRRRSGILGKLEGFNPGGIKDRTALRGKGPRAAARDELRPGRASSSPAKRHPRSGLGVGGHGVRASGHRGH